MARPSFYATRQELAGRRYRSLKFVNDYSFVALSVSHQGDYPQLDVFNTEHETGLKPVQTSFSFSTARMDAPLRLLSDPYGHAPLPDELTASPFYSDSSQRILVLSIDEYQWLTINVELLLELAREQEGQRIEWEEWGDNTIQIQAGGDTINRIGVFGCRLLCIMSGMDEEGSALSYLRTYDLNHAGRAKHLRVIGSLDSDRGVRRISPSLDGYKLPWHPGDLDGATLSAGHDGFIFCVVSTPRSPFLPAHN